MATHRRGALVRMGGVGLIAAGILAAGTAYADAGSGPDVLHNITNVLGVTGGPLDTHDNDGPGAGNQADVAGHAPVAVDCNGVTVLGAALATCAPTADREATPGTGYGGTGYGSGYGGTGYGSGYPGGGYGTPGSPGTPKSGPSASTSPKTGGRTPHVLAATGTASGPLGLAGGALLLTGAGLVIVGRRPARRRGAHAA